MTIVRTVALGRSGRRTGPERHMQRGGTFLGFVVGVVVGLAAALAVAVYVTKVPVPFMNKMPVRAPDQDAAEAKKNKNWDPNAPLYKKGAEPAAAVTAPQAAGAQKAPASAPAAAPSADPLGDLARAKASAATTEPAVTAAAQPAALGVDPFAYFVQAGAFRTLDDANAQRAKISLSGLDAKVSEREQSGRVVFRVRLGPFDQKEEADRAKEKLASAGFEAALVRVQR